MDLPDLPPLPRLAARDGPDAAQELLKLLKNPFSVQLGPAALYSALGTSLGVTAFIAICFSFLRPYNQAIYAPRLKHADEKHAPPPIGRKPWSWITPLLRTDESLLVRQIGMDAVVFLRFIRMCRNMFLVLALVGTAILIPVHLASTVKSYDGGKTVTEWIIQITPSNVFGRAHWAQVVVAWLFNAVIAGFLWWNYRRVLQLRRQYFEGDDYQTSLHSRTLMLSDLPRQACSDEGIARIIDQVVPNSSFARTAVARNVKDLPDLIDEHAHAVRTLEKILARYLRDPARLPPARPSCRPERRDRAFDTYPRGQKLDAIDYYTQRIRDLEVEVREVRASVDKRGTMPYGFASYSDIAEAHAIAHACRRKRPRGARITLAPRPADITWRNMPLSSATRARRRWINNVWIAVLTLLWVGPNAMIAIFLVDLGNLGRVWPAFARSLAANRSFWGMVQGIASPALMSLVYLVLPILFRRMSIKAGDQTKTGRERHVLGKMYAFFVFNNLVVFSFFSVVWSFVAGVVDTTNRDHVNAWDAIQRQDLAAAAFVAFCNNGLFWVTYLLQRQLGAAIDLAQIWPLVQAFFLKKFSSPTPRELIELTAPPPFDYASYYNYFLFYATVTLCFAGIQPLVLPATAMYFCIDSYLKKYLILYRFVTKTESGGLFWRVLFNRFVLATVLANLVVMLTCWVRGEGTHVQFYAVTPLPLLMLAFKAYCRTAFDSKIRYYSTRGPAAGMREAAAGPAATAHKEAARLRSEKLSTRFGHPALYMPLITPMVHSRAQNLLPSVYRGRLTDGREAGPAGPGGGDLVSVSGYSDMYALDAMQQGGRPGKSAAAGNVPGFEYVSESHMDFEYYKNRADFADQHGGGEMYGRPATPSTLSMIDDGGGGSDRSLSRPASPLSGRSSTPFVPGVPPRRVATGTSDTSYHPHHHHHQLGRPAAYDPVSTRGRSPLYAHENSSSSGLVRNAAGVPTSNPPGRYGGGRDGSVDRGGRATPGVGSPVGGPRGYTGLSQSEDPVDGHDGGGDPTQYSYFRGGSRPVRPPGEGW